MTKQEAAAIDIVVFLARHWTAHGDKLANAKQIHDAVGTPVRFAEAAMQRLTRAGIIRSKCGAEGGYHFCGRTEVTIDNILRVIGDQHVKAPGGEASCVVVGFLSYCAETLTVAKILEQTNHVG